jgi:hypothetical protein
MADGVVTFHRGRHRFRVEQVALDTRETLIRHGGLVEPGHLVAHRFEMAGDVPAQEPGSAGHHDLHSTP